MPFSGHDFPGKIDHLILVFDYGQISDPCILRRRQGKPDSIHQNGNLVNQPNLLIREQVFKQDGLIGKGNSHVRHLQPEQGNLIFNPKMDLNQTARAGSCDGGDFGSPRGYGEFVPFVEKMDSNNNI